MTNFISLKAITAGLTRLDLYHVIFDDHDEWLVSFKHKRSTYKWFYSYSTALAYYEKRSKRIPSL